MIAGVYRSGDEPQKLDDAKGERHRFLFVRALLRGLNSDRPKGTDPTLNRCSAYCGRKVIVLLPCTVLNSIGKLWPL